MNWRAVQAIYMFEMHRTWRTLMQSIAAPVISTSLYFVVFGTAIGSRMSTVHGIPYGSFLVPGLIMMQVLTQSVSNASFGIYFPKFTGTIYEVLSAPISYFEIVTGYVGAAASKAIILGLIILATANLFVPVHIAHPLLMLAFLLLTAFTFAMMGFLIGIWADGFEKLQMVPLLVITPLSFLGGSFYSLSMLPPFWRTITLFNPLVYLISAFRWAFFDIADVAVGISLAATLLFLVICLMIGGWM
ncbi:MAG: ABC transporter permease, partial [Caulobacteraceae bacterium]